MTGKKHTLRTGGGLLAALATVIGGALAPAPADAAPTEAPLSVTVTGCETVVMTSRATAEVPASAVRVFGGDGWPEQGITTGSGTYTLRAGHYTWRLDVGNPLRPYSHGSFTVKQCTGGPMTVFPRVADGDENRDGRADLLAVRQDGNLYYYRSTATGLASAVKVGSGWQNVDWMARTVDPEALLARHTDGTLWIYDRQGNGRYANGRKVGSSFGAYTDLTVVPGSWAKGLSQNTLVGRRNGKTYAWPLVADPLLRPAAAVVIGSEPATLRQSIPLRDFDGDGWADFLRVNTDGTLGAALVDWTGRTTLRTGMGRGWTAFTRLYSPGDLTGDGLPDLIARRRDGVLLMYPNVRSSNGQRAWGTPVRFGTSWQTMKVIA